MSTHSTDDIPERTVDADHPEAGPRSTVARFAVGDVINSLYMVQQRISGGMSDVYLCLTRGGGWRFVALKFPKINYDGRASAQHRAYILDEARHWAELDDHPNVAKCLHMGVLDDQAFLVLEWIGAPDPPRDVAALFGRDQLATESDREEALIRIADQICAGLEHIHGSGIIHADIKPSNLLVDENAQVKVTDLGIGAKTIKQSLVQRGLRMLRRPNADPSNLRGTYRYLAPECWAGGRHTIQSDIYALGCVLYELATGEHVYAVNDTQQLREMHESVLIDRVHGIGDALSKLVIRCLAKRPARRPRSVTEIRHQLIKLKALHGITLPAEANGEEEERAFPVEYTRDMQRVSLQVAAGRLNEAIEQQSVVIRAAMKHWSLDARNVVGEEPERNLAWLFNDRGLLRAKGDIHGAGLDFLTAIRLDPGLAVAYSNLGSYYRELGLPSLAISAVERALDLDPHDHRFRLRRAVLLSQFGWHELALADCEHALSLQPADAEASWRMADVLFALGREDEAAGYRERSRELGGTGSFQEWYRPTRIHENDQLMRGLVSTDRQEAIRAYTRVLQADARNVQALYLRATAFSEAADYEMAARDLASLFEFVSTTDVRLRRAEQMWADLPEDVTLATPRKRGPESLPWLKSSDYIAHRLGRRITVAELTNWLPVSARQRSTMLDMLYAGDEGRRHRAVRLAWQTYHKKSAQRMEMYREKICGITGRSDEFAQPLALSFADCEMSGDVVMRNGLGLPVVMTECRVSRGKIDKVGFLEGVPIAVGWYSEKTAGVWNVVPAFERNRVNLHPDARTMCVLDDGSGYLVRRGQAIAIVHPASVDSEDDDDTSIPGWELPTTVGSVTAACVSVGHSAVLGLSSGAVAILPRTGDQPHELTCDSGNSGGAHVACDGGDQVAVYHGSSFYVISQRNDLPESYRLTLARRIPQQKGPLLHFSSRHALFSASADEISLVSVETGESLILRARDSTSREGFVAAGISLDGDVAVAVCGQYLHVWRRAGGDSGFASLPITPQMQGSCVAVSRDGRFVAVGTVAGSIVLFRLDELRGVKDAEA